MLTKKQKDLLIFIHRRVQETGVSPSFDEMKDALDLKSKSGIHRLITALEERGFIRRLAHKARALEILKLPDVVVSLADSSAGDNAGSSRGVDQVANSHSNVIPFRDAQPVEDHKSVQIPLMGRIAAGVPISAIQDHSSDITVSPEMIGPGNHYALEVHGDSMIDEGILDGDMVLIRETSSAKNGDIVVAFIVEEEEATLKKIYKSGNSIELVAANPAYEPRVFTSDKVEVQGQLVGLVRRYH